MIVNFNTYKLIKESVKLIFDEDSMSTNTDLSKFLNELDDNLETLVNDAIITRLQELLSIQGLNVIETKVKFGNYELFIETTNKMYVIKCNKNRKDILALHECYKPVLLKTQYQEGILGVIKTFNNLKDLVKELKIHDQDAMTCLNIRNSNNVEMSYLVHDADLKGTLEEVKCKLLDVLNDKYNKLEFPYDGHLYDAQASFDRLELKTIILF